MNILLLLWPILAHGEDLTMGRLRLQEPDPEELRNIQTLEEKLSRVKAGDPEETAIVRSRIFESLAPRYAKATTATLLARLAFPSSEVNFGIKSRVLNELRSRPGSEVCRALLEFGQREWSRDSPLAVQALATVGSFRDGDGRKMTRGFLGKIAVPTLAIQLARESGRQGDSEALPEILKVYDKYKNQTDCAPLMEAFFLVGTKECLGPLRELLLVEKTSEWAFQKWYGFLALVKLGFSDAEIRKAAISLLPTYRLQSSRSPEPFEAAVRFLASRSEDAAESVLAQLALPSRGRGWEAQPQEDIWSGLYGEFGLASLGHAEALSQLGRYLTCVKRVTVEEKGLRGDRQDVDVDLGGEIRKVALRLTSELTGQVFETPAQAAAWLDRNSGSLKWNPASRMFNPN